MVSAERSHQSDAADPVLDEPAVLRLVRAHFPTATALTGIDETGGEARAYLVDDGLVVKTQRPHRVRDSTSLAKEALFLEHLAASEPGLPVPRVLGHGETDQGEYMVMTRIPGTALARSGLNPVARAGALQAAGRLLPRIHAIDQAPLIASGLFPGDGGPEDLPGRIRSSLGRVLPTAAAKEGWPAELDPEQVIETSLAATPTDTSPVALHTNPGPEHVFVDPDTGAFTGLIDFADSYRSHPAFDPRTWVSREDSDALLAGYAEANSLSDGFMAVWHVALIIQEAAFAARGWRPTAEAAEGIRQLVQQLG